MGNPVLGIGSSVGMKLETTPGTKIALTTGAAWLDLVSEGLDHIPVLHRIAPVVGNRQAHGDFEFVSHSDGSGNIVARVRGDYLAALCDFVLGDSAAGVYYPIVDDSADLPTYTVEGVKGGQNNVRLVGCKCNTATFRSETNSPLQVELNVVAMSGERDAVDLATPSYTSWLATPPMMHGGMSFDATDEAWLGGASGPECRMIEWTLNNNLDIEGYTNSTDRKIIPVGLFEVTGSMEIPYNSVTKGFWAEMVAAAKVKFQVEYSDGSATLTVDFVVKLEGELPKIAGPENVWLTLNFHGVADATDVHAIEMTVA